MLSILCVSMASLVGAAPASTHVRPVSNLPKALDPVEVVDVFSTNAAVQLHAALFRLSASNVPLPDLVDDFDVSSDGRIYQFTLAERRFHDGKFLTWRDVRASLEHALRSKVVGHSELAALKGYQELLDGTRGILSGFVPGGSERDFSLQLTRPDPGLVRALARIEFAILAAKRDAQIGLGPYKLAESTPTTLRLVAVDAGGGRPDTLVYERADKETAVEGFVHGRFHDLVMYDLSQADLGRVAAHGELIRLPYRPRTFIFAVNARRQPDVDLRGKIIAQFARDTLLRRCFPNETAARSFVPPGFLGFDENELLSALRSPRAQTGRPPNGLVIRVADGLPGGDCIEAHLRSAFAEAKVDVRRADSLEIMNAWLAGRLDAFVGYLEVETARELFLFLDPRSRFFLGSPATEGMGPLLASIDRETKLAAKHDLIARASRLVLEARTLWPLFQPEQAIVYSNRYRPLDVGMRSPLYVPASELTFKN